MKKLRGRWHPTVSQISIAIDCATAKMPLGKAAELHGIKPRSLWIFARRLGLPTLFKVWENRPRYVPVSSGAGRPRTAETQLPRPFP
jgi:hypothetical protein